MLVDYVIVGAGSAGCVLSDRLTESGQFTVLLLEAGGNPRRWMDMPLAWRDSYKSPRVNWGYVSDPEPWADGRSVAAHRGKVLGGTSSINGMLYARGFAADYDRWRNDGLRGWGYADVLAYFRKAETSWRGGGLFHGADGPLTVSRHVPEPSLHAALAATARKHGIDCPDDIYASNDSQFGVPDFTIRGGRRASTAAAYLARALKRKNLQVISQAQVTRIEIVGGRATAVLYRRGGQTVHVSARREVIVAAGAFNSPQLLLLSGIGPAAELALLGIEPVRNLPGVGKNLQDHHAINFAYRLDPDVSFDRQLRIDRMVRSVIQWMLFGTGSASRVPVAGQIFRCIDAMSGWPDMQMVIAPVALDARLWLPGWRSSVGDQLTASNVLLRPRSTGEVSLRTPSPYDAPRLRFNLLADPLDRACFRSMVRFTERFFASAPISDFLRGRVSPPAPLVSDSEIDAFVRERIATAMHPAGTCAMGIGDMAVLDHECRVRDVEGVRVVDASAMPHVVSGNTNAPVIMMAEKVSDLILGASAAAELTPHDPGSSRHRP